MRVNDTVRFTQEALKNMPKACAHWKGRLSSIREFGNMQVAYIVWQHLKGKCGAEKPVNLNLLERVED